MDLDKRFPSLFLQRHYFLDYLEANNCSKLFRFIWEEIFYLEAKRKKNKEKFFLIRPSKGILKFHSHFFFVQLKLTFPNKTFIKWFTKFYFKQQLRRLLKPLNGEWKRNRQQLFSIKKKNKFSERKLSFNICPKVAFDVSNSKSN